MGVVYMARNKITGDAYVGMTIGEFRRRMRRHYNDARRGDGFRFARAICKYGEDSFEWSILFESDSRAELCQKEIEFIGQFGTYNIAEGGEGASGVSPSAETRSKISLSLRGKPFTEERRAHIGEAQKGRKRKPLSAETRAKIGEANKKWKHPSPSAETRSKLSEAQKGKFVPPEVGAKISAAKTGKKRGSPSPEWRANVGAGLRAYHAARKAKMQEVSNA